MYIIQCVLQDVLIRPLPSVLLQVALDVKDYSPPKLLLNVSYGQ